MTIDIVISDADGWVEVPLNGGTSLTLACVRNGGLTYRFEPTSTSLGIIVEHNSQLPVMNDKSFFISTSGDNIIATFERV